ncbi:YkgJ family cysteine cluster protein [Streptosporangium sp. NPDC049248]|uniref:YkgJ family cysteine cluster protein n=1 Tax=Streptosporangium sp. NPDC049248 TaxID=3155651 RepID=UPI00341A21AD
MSEWTDRQDVLLEELYAKVPDAGCKGLCQEHCTTIAGGRREAQRMAEAGFHLPTSVAVLLREARSSAAAAEPCAALGDDGRCRVYEVRPLICRLWGSTEGMPCEHGCVPEGGRLTDVEAALLIKRSKRI